MSRRKVESDTLAESIFSEQSTESLEERIQLIRILSRSSTLPKIENILIRSMMSRPDGFFIHPGHSINIGVNLLSNPIAALLCLRYGIEWQIWYQRMPKNSLDVRICDMAACRVTARFYELIPQEDKQAIDQIPTKIAEVILRFSSENDEIPDLDEQAYETLGELHNQSYSDDPLNPDQLEVLKELGHPTEALFMMGGDLRLNVDPGRLLNKYGCRPFPRPEALTFASSTATSVSNAAFSRTEIKRQFLIESGLQKGLQKTMNKFAGHLRKKLKKTLTLPEDTTIILAPSGTDISLQVAGICQSIFSGKMVHILVASDESGSGVPLALEGRHFSDRTALDFKVQKGEFIEGFESSEVILLSLRDESGRLKPASEVDAEVEEIISEALDQGSKPVLHVMDQSKLGYTAPSEDYLHRVENVYGDRVLKMVDNSQLRMDQEDIRSYIQRDYLMTITGSKYFTGPPFSGALVIPRKFSLQWAAVNNTLPSGLEMYNCKNECPPNWELGSNLPERLNLGLYMRWYSALVEIERYFLTPISLRYLGMEMFCNHVARVIEKAPFLIPLQENQTVTAKSNGHHLLKNRRTIFPFFVKKDDHILSHQEVTRMYRLLNEDLSERTDIATGDLDRIASQACHIGQPVKAYDPDGHPSAVVRISLGARVISESWKDQDVSIYFQKIEQQMNQVDIIIRKIEYLIDQEFYL